MGGLGVPAGLGWATSRPRRPDRAFRVLLPARIGGGGGARVGKAGARQGDRPDRLETDGGSAGTTRRTTSTGRRRRRRPESLQSAFAPNSTSSTTAVAVRRVVPRPAFRTAVARLAARPRQGDGELVGEDVSSNINVPGVSPALPSRRSSSLADRRVGGGDPRLPAAQHRQRPRPRRTLARARRELRGRTVDRTGGRAGRRGEGDRDESDARGRVTLRRAILANPIEYVIPAAPGRCRARGTRLQRRREETPWADAGGRFHVWRSAHGTPAAARIPRSAAPHPSDPGLAVSPHGRTSRRSATAAAPSSGRRPRAGASPVSVLPCGSASAGTVACSSRSARTATQASGGQPAVASSPSCPGSAASTRGWGPGRHRSFPAPRSAARALLALAGADGIVRVWELATRKQVAAAAMGWANTWRSPRTAACSPG